MTRHCQNVSKNLQKGCEFYFAYEHEQPNSGTMRNEAIEQCFTKVGMFALIFCQTTEWITLYDLLNFYCNGFTK